MMIVGTTSDAVMRIEHPKWWEAAEYLPHVVRMGPKNSPVAELELVAWCAPCGWQHRITELEMLAQPPWNLETYLAEKMGAAISAHVRPPPLTIAELTDLGYFDPEAA